MHLVELGFPCNNSCVFCAQGRLGPTAPAPRFEILEARVDAAPMGDTLAFVGGEPTLIEGLGVLVDRARRRGVSRILVQTNARRLASAGVAESLARSGVTSLDVSLHGDNEFVHDYHTGVAGSFHQTIVGLRRARAAHLQVAISTVVTRSNFRHLAGIVRVAHTLGAEAVRLALVRPLGAGRDNAARLVPSRRMLWPHLARAVELAHNLGLGFSAPDFELTSGPGVKQWFAGPGSIETVPEPVASSAGASRRLHMIAPGSLPGSSGNPTRRGPPGERQRLFTPQGVAACPANF